MTLFVLKYFSLMGVDHGSKMQWGANVNEKKGSKPIQPFTGTLTYNSNVNMLCKPTQSLMIKITLKYF
jgi:hypothetical protein